MREAYGVDAARLLRANLHRLADEIHGIDFFTADSLRVMLGIGPTSPFRLHAALKSVGRTHKVQAVPLLLEHLCQLSLCVRFGRTRPVLLPSHIREGQTRYRPRDGMDV